MSLTQTQQQAAHLLGSGRGRNEIAADLGVAPSSISRWRKNPDFEELVEKTRLRVIADDPEPRDTLRAALSARESDGVGIAAWRVRVFAAAKLLDLGKKLPQENNEEPEVWISDALED